MAKERILVVDGEEDILELVRFHLALKGYQLTLAASGEEALKNGKKRQKRKKNGAENITLFW